MLTEHMPDTRPYNHIEVGFLVRFFRETHGWTQETLAELSGLTTRTVQRVENAQPSSVDTRRALARAFEMDDIDVFNKPHEIQTESEVKERAEKIQRDHVTLDVDVVSTGKQLADMVEGLTAFVPNVRDDIADGAKRTVAEIFDFLTEYLDSYDLYKFAAKLDVHEQLSADLAQLRQHGLVLCVAKYFADATVANRDETSPTQIPIGYFFVSHQGAEPRQVMVPKTLQVR